MPTLANDAIGVAILAIFPVCMIFATFFDLFTMTIPNRINLVLVASFLVLAPLAGMDLTTMGLHFAVAAGVLLVGFIFFAFGFMGGGDAKLLAASALWFGPNDTLVYIVMAALLGGLLTIGIVMLRAWPLPPRLMSYEWLVRLHKPKEGVPYGAALGPAALYLFAATPWFGYAVHGTLAA